VIGLRSNTASRVKSRTGAAEHDGIAALHHLPRHCTPEARHGVTARVPRRALVAFVVATRTAIAAVAGADELESGIRRILDVSDAENTTPVVLQVKR
jgi:hypothetical protein